MEKTKNKINSLANTTENCNKKKKLHTEEKQRPKSSENIFGTVWRIKKKKIFDITKICQLWTSLPPFFKVNLLGQLHTGYARWVVQIYTISVFFNTSLDHATTYWVR